MSEGFKNLIVWHKAYELTLEIYKMTARYPKHEQYGLVSQIRRAAISVNGNIAEGYERRHRREYIQFLNMAKGSLGEVEAYLLFSQDLGYISMELYRDVDLKRKEVGKLLTGLLRSLCSGPRTLAP
jgi:four helix bundle protein